jgi:ATP-binding cassette subfamily C protein LapB
LARILIRKPKILFLDEPTAHFDVRSEAEFLGRLQARETSETIVVATHRPSVLALMDRVLVFDNGKLVADGPREEITARMRAPQPQPPQPGTRNAAV